jgi:hypothetical protein
MRVPHRKSTRHRHTSPHTLLKVGLALLGMMLIPDIIAVHFFPQIEAALSLPAINAGNTAPAQSTMPKSSLTLDQQLTLAQDTFSRVNQTSWCIASDGQLWQAAAQSSSSFAIVNHAGQVSQADGIYDAILGPIITNAEVVFSGSLSRFGASTLGALLRWKDANNLYKVYIDGSHLILLKDVTGIVTVLKSVIFPAQGGQSYTFHFRVRGTFLSANVWPTHSPEPANWLVTTTDTSLSSGYGGLRMVLRNGITALITSFTESKL